MPVDFDWKLSEKARKELEIRDGQIFRCGLRIALLAHLVCGFLGQNTKSTPGQHLLFVTHDLACNRTSKFGEPRCIICSILGKFCRHAGWSPFRT